MYPVCVLAMSVFKTGFTQLARIFARALWSVHINVSGLQCSKYSGDFPFFWNE